MVHEDSARPSKRLTSRKDHERYAITFCEASVHAGGVGQESSGAMAEDGFYLEELRTIQAAIRKNGGVAEYVPLVTNWQPPASKWVSKVNGHRGERTMADLEAGVLVIRNAADHFMGPGAADALFEEQSSFSYDELYYNVRQHKMLMKNARYNVVFGEDSVQQGFASIPAVMPDKQSPNFRAEMDAYKQKVVSYNLVDPRTQKPFVNPRTGAIVNPNKKKEWRELVAASSSMPPNPVKYFQTVREGDHVSTVKAFSELPLLSQIRESLGSLSSKSRGLVAEGNHYYGPKSNINYHGDGERKIICCLCLGKSTKLTYQWRFPEANAAVQQRFAATITANHGDIYIMSEKAGGYDWKFGRNQWPEPRLVHGAAFEQSTLDAFMERKGKKKK